MWIVVNIGCIERDVSSGIVGVFDDEERAYEVANTCTLRLAYEGDRRFEVFPLPSKEGITEEYFKLLDESFREGDRGV